MNIGVHSWILVFTSSLPNMFHRSFPPLELHLESRIATYVVIATFFTHPTGLHDHSLASHSGQPEESGATFRRVNNPSPF